MFIIDQGSADDLRLSAGERALLAALVECPQTTVSGVANLARLSTSMVRRTLRRFEAVGAAVSVRQPSIDGSSAPVLWSAAPWVLHLVEAPGQASESGSSRPMARDKILTTVGLRPGLPAVELAWRTALSRRGLLELLTGLEREGLVRRVTRRGRHGRRLADGWALTRAEPDEPLFELGPDGDQS